jgi:hypothetical protein
LQTSLQLRPSSSVPQFGQSEETSRLAVAASEGLNETGFSLEPEVAPASSVIALLYHSGATPVKPAAQD